MGMLSLLVSCYDTSAAFSLGLGSQGHCIKACCECGIGQVPLSTGPRFPYPGITSDWPPEETVIFSVILHLVSALEHDL